MSKKTKINQQIPIDLVADFYSQEKLDLVWLAAQLRIVMKTSVV